MPAAPYSGQLVLNEHSIHDSLVKVLPVCPFYSYLLRSAGTKDPGSALRPCR